MEKIKKGDKVIVLDTNSYNDKIPDKAPFIATIDENVDDFEYWLTSDVTGYFYSLYSTSIKKIHQIEEIKK